MLNEGICFAWRLLDKFIWSILFFPKNGRLYISKLRMGEKKSGVYKFNRNSQIDDFERFRTIHSILTE